MELGMKLKNHKSYVVTLLLSIFLFVSIITFIMNIFFTTTSKNIIMIGDKTTTSAVKVVEEFLKENIDIIAIESQSIEYMMEKKSPNSDIKEYLEESSNGYAGSIDSSFTGFYGVFRGEYLDGANWIPSKDFVPETRPWYLNAVEADGETVISSPYIDKQTGDVMISFSQLLSDKKSVIAVDINLNRLDELVAEVKSEGYGECVILDSKGLVVSSSMNDKGINYKNGEGGIDKEFLANKIYESEKINFEQVFENKKSIIFSNYVYGNWRSVLIMNKKSLFQEMNKNIFVSVSASLLLMGLILHFCIYSNKKRRAAEKNLMQVKAASSIYVSMAEINLMDDTFELIYSLANINEILSKVENKASMALDFILRILVTEEYLSSSLEFVNLKTVAERIGDKSTITQEFLGKTRGWCCARFIAVDHSDNGKPVHVLFAVEDINEAKLHEERLIADASVDKLTGCFNRKSYEEEISFYSSNPMENDFIHFSVDVNSLKDVNDSFGHAAGDELIKGAAEILKKNIRPYGKVFRTGGDEFFAIIHADESSLQNLLNEIQTDMQNWRGVLIQELTFSIGYAQFSKYPEKTLPELCKIADKNMYENKARFYMEKGINLRGKQSAYEAICKSYTKILLVNLTFDNYQIIQIDENERNSEKGFNEHISTWLKDFATSGQVHEDDFNEYLEKTDINYLRNYFLSGKKNFVIKYRRKINGEFKNVMLELVPSNKYCDDNQSVFLYVKNLF